MVDIFKEMLEDIFSGQSKKYPLQKKKDTAFELSYWLKELSALGNEAILSETTSKGDNIIVYRQRMDEDGVNIALRSKIFSVEGNESITPSMYLIYKKKYEILEIADIRMEDSDTNRGYGSIFMKAMFLLIERSPYTIKYVTGWISGVDWDHIDRNEYFYKKFDFEVNLNHEERDGNILWINPSKSGSIEDYQSLNYKPGIAGLMQELSEIEDKF
ncbi:hypothetical protein JCM16418A_42110 [Paenibacillus pini]